MNHTAQFNPSPWLPGGHLQTVWRKFSQVTPLPLRRQRLELPDGDFIDLDWSAASGDLLASSQPIVLLIHGLCGSSASGYIRAAQDCLTRHGFASVAMNFRGCSGEPNRLARAYHSGVSEDLEAVYQKLCTEYPAKHLAVVGYSLGANVTLKWLAESRPTAVIGAVAVSTPFRLEACSASMNYGIGRFYGRFFLRRLVQDTREKMCQLRRNGASEQLALLESCGDFDRLQGLWDFDDRVTAPIHGFADARDYYQRCSSIGFLPQITVPVLLVQSLDDPIIPAVALPQPESLNNNIHVAFSRSGGHVGFVSRDDPKWLEHRIISFISGLAVPESD